MNEANTRAELIYFALKAAGRSAVKVSYFHQDEVRTVAATTEDSSVVRHEYLRGSKTTIRNFRLVRW